MVDRSFGVEDIFEAQAVVEDAMTYGAAKLVGASDEEIARTYFTEGEPIMDGVYYLELFAAYGDRVEAGEVDPEVSLTLDVVSRLADERRRGLRKD
ncbi:MAG TPA: hypothetical protein VJC09_01275 [Candidatus Saccharimonadales bacterium]|nr:hypothetical protein [Candidatus Saccharimonadales bacterium]